MTKTLRVLVVEDSQTDFELLVRELGKGEFELFAERVETPEAMAAALANQRWDIVISDWSLPRFSAPAALALLEETSLDLPFIIVSGTIGEDTAVEALKRGAHDFLVKHSLVRLLPAVERELREAAVRRERDKMREQLMISDRMASIGILAAGVAHEINNPLACVIANLELTALDLAELAGRDDDAGQLCELVRDASEAALAIRGIVRDLAVFSRSDEDRRESVDIPRVMDSSLRMAWNEIRHRARLVKEYGEVPAVMASESRLGQVFLNLIVNAAQAIPEGRVERHQIRIRIFAEGLERVVVEVSDTGSGMPPDVLKKLFTPFFTTKAAGAGTGLGLTICHRIVASLGGEISAHSELGKGTLFRVVLPADSRQSDRDRAIPCADPAPGARRRGRVLLVDDEPMIAAVVSRLLSLEHEVTAVESASDALARISGGERYDVILSDLMMPEMSGMDLYAELSRRVPEQAERIVFLTGGAFTPRARDFLDRVPNQRLEKPFETQQLRATVNERIR